MASDQNDPVFVRLTKQSSLHADSEANLSTSYWVEGILEQEPVVGERLTILRLANQKHPEGRLGIFSTSLVTKIEVKKTHRLIHTTNSVYKLETIDKP